MSAAECTVMLTAFEWDFANQVACARQRENIAKGRRAVYGETATPWDVHLQGAAAEMALAKHLGIYWTGNLGDLGAADVGHYQVRSSQYDNARLMLHPPDQGPFVLLTGSAPSFVIRGWIEADDGKQPAYWCDPTARNRWAYFVPQWALLPLRGNGR